MEPIGIKHEPQCIIVNPRLAKARFLMTACGASTTRAGSCSTWPLVAMGIRPGPWRSRQAATTWRPTAVTGTCASWKRARAGSCSTWPLVTLGIRSGPWRSRQAARISTHLWHKHILEVQGFVGFPNAWTGVRPPPTVPSLRLRMKGGLVHPREGRHARRCPLNFPSLVSGPGFTHYGRQCRAQT